MDNTGVIPLPAAIRTWCAGRGQVRGERARRRLHLDHVAGPDLVHQPAGHRAARHLAHADARRPPGGGADRVGAPLVAARTVTDCPGAKANLSASGGGTSKVTAAESSVSGSTRVDGERVELGPAAAWAHQISLTYSKGSRQASQRNSALQAVALNAAVRVGVGGAAARAGDRLAAPAVRVERDRARPAVPGARAAAGRCRPRRSLRRPSARDPVAAPGGRERGAHGDVGESGLGRAGAAGRARSRAAPGSPSRSG